MAKVPVTSLIPALALYYASLASEKIVFSEDYIELGISPASLNLISSKANDKLKEI